MPPRPGDFYLVRDPGEETAAILYVADSARRVRDAVPGRRVYRVNLADGWTDNRHETGAEVHYSAPLWSYRRPGGLWTSTTRGRWAARWFALGCPQGVAEDP